MSDLFSEVMEVSEHGAVPRRRPLPDMAARSAATDPSTSREAAAKITHSGKVRGDALTVLRLVKMFPRMTYQELFHRQVDSSLDAVTVMRRLDTLVEVGLARHVRGADGQDVKRECTIKKTRMVIWELTELGDATQA